MRAEEAKDITQNTIKQDLITKGVYDKIKEAAELGKYDCKVSFLSKAEITYLKDCGYFIDYNHYTEVSKIIWS